MAEAIAKTGGAVCVNFFPAFLDAAYYQAFRPIDDQLEVDPGRGEAADADQRIPAFDCAATERVAAGDGGERGRPRAAPREGGRRRRGLHRQRLRRIPVAPEGLDDASGMPLLTAELLRRGMGKKDVAKVLGGNLLRVLAATE